MFSTLSILYRRNKRDPNTAPCGTHELALTSDEKALPNETNCDLFLKISDPVK